MKTQSVNNEQNEKALEMRKHHGDPDRRGVMKSVLAATAAGLGLANVPAEAQTNADLRIGVNNNAGTTATVLTMNNALDNAFIVSNSGTGSASAILGIGNGPSKIGVFGLAQAGGFAAIVARAENSQFGIAADTDNPTSAGGAFANTGGGAALLVQGRIRVVNSGSGVVPASGSIVGAAGQRIISVSKNFIKADSLVLVTMVGNPGSGASVQWIELMAGTGFNIHLTSALGVNTSFLYIIIEQS
jgi:hypothetical protein